MKYDAGGEPLAMQTAIVRYTGTKATSNGRSASVNFSARNLHRWTNYRGLDPEIDRQAGDSNNNPGDEFQTLGLPTYFTLRLNLGF